MQKYCIYNITDVTRRILSCQAANLLTGPVWFCSDAVRSDDPDRSFALHVAGHFPPERAAKLHQFIDMFAFFSFSSHCKKQHPQILFY
jgi:hypothetical protein